MSLWPGPEAGRQIIDGLEYTEHAVTQMMTKGLLFDEAALGTTNQASRGVPPSVVENAIQFEQK